MLIVDKFDEMLSQIFFQKFYENDGDKFSTSFIYYVRERKTLRKEMMQYEGS
jgi:hypothetical protein